MHHVGHEVDVTTYPWCRAGVADQRGQGCQRDRCDNPETRRCRPKDQNAKQQRERQPHAPHQSETRVEQHRPGAAMQTDIGQGGTENVGCQQRQPGRPRKRCNGEREPCQDIELVAKRCEIPPDFSAGWFCHKHQKGDRSACQQCRGKMQAADQGQWIEHQQMSRVVRLIAQRGR